MKILSATSNRHDVLRERWEIPGVDQIMVEERPYAERTIDGNYQRGLLLAAVSGALMLVLVIES
ncbi:MAG: hypothetical protein ACRD5Z_00460 [Bryobacteraceae bacterium]